MAKQKTLKVLKKEIKQINFHLPEKDFRALQKKPTFIRIRICPRGFAMPDFIINPNNPNTDETIFLASA